MGAATLIIAGAFVVLTLRPGDPDAAARARARVLAALPAPSAEVALEPAPPRTPLGPSVLARRAPAPQPPPLLTLPADVATALPADSPAARREVQFAPSDTSRPTVYRLPDGRLFVVQQTPSDRGRPTRVNWFEETNVRGHYAQMYTSTTGPLRALVWWTEDRVSYYLYSATVTPRELMRLTEQLR